LLVDHAAGWEERFDTVFYINVMEHVEKDAEEVARALACVKPGGHLLIFVPALPWLYGKADEMFGHFRRYTQSSLLKLLDRQPADVLRCQYWDILGVLPWWVSFVLLRRGVMSPTMVKLYDSAVVPVAKLLEGAAPPPVGKNLLLVARKNGSLV
jgi:SAM-dependent methyltransferase